MEKEWHKVFLTLAVCLCSVVLIAVPNFLLWGHYRYWDIEIIPYLFITFCGYSTINLFVYIFMKRDFRKHLLFLISFGLVKKKEILGNQKSELRMLQIQPYGANRSECSRDAPPLSNSRLSVSTAMSGMIH